MMSETPRFFSATLKNRDWALILDFKINIRRWTEIQTSDLQISILALYNLNYPSSINSIGENISLESNALQGFVVFDTICHPLICELNAYLFTYLFIPVFFK